MSQEPPSPHPGPDSHLAQPKLKFFDKRFWIGLGVGAVAGLVLLNGVLIVFVLMLHAHVTRSAGTTADEAGSSSTLPIPQFPGSETAWYRLKLEGLDGTPFDAGTLKGKVVFLNFWATWCGPCRSEMPAIQHLYEETKDQGVTFLVVSDEERERIAGFVKKNGYTFPVYRVVGVPPEVFRTSVIPATFIVAPDGHIAYRRIGSAQWDNDAALAFLKTLAPSAP
jgi:thiol-disulfide isomerase/thioredoxin